MENKKDKIVDNGKVFSAVRGHYVDYHNYIEEFKRASFNTWRMIHGYVDWSHKGENDAKIHLNQLGLGYERWKATIKQGLMNWDEWLKVESKPFMESEYMDQYETKRFIETLTRDCDLRATLADNLGLGYVENLVITKVLTRVVDVQGPGNHKRQSVRTKLVPLSLWEYVADPWTPEASKTPLYQMSVGEYRKYDLYKRAKDEPGPGELSKEKVKELKGSVFEYHTEYEFVKGSVLDNKQKGGRHSSVVIEFFGTLLDPDSGFPIEYKKENGEIIELEDVFFTVGDFNIMLSEPVKLSEAFLDGEMPFVRVQLLRSNKHLVGRSIGQTGYELNITLDEMMSAQVDSAMTEGNNITWVNASNLEDETQISGGIPYREPLRLAPGAMPQETLGSIPQGSLSMGFFNVYQEARRSLAENLGKSELGLSGALPGKQVLATEVVSSENISQGLDESILSDVEDIHFEKLIMKIFHQGLNYAKFLSDEDLEYIFGKNPEKIEKFKELAKNKKKLFDELAFSFRFRGRGIRGVMQSRRAGQYSLQLMSLFASNPLIAQQIEQQGWSLGKISEKAVIGMGLDPEELKDERVAEFARAKAIALEVGRGAQEASGAQTGQAQGSQNVRNIPGNAPGIEPGNGGE